MRTSDRFWKVVLYAAAAVAIAIGGFEAYQQAKLSTPLPTGSKAPPFSAVTRDGQTISLPADRVVVLSFWATWCGPCRREYPILRRLAAELGPRGVALVAANLDDADAREDVERWLQKEGGAEHVVFPGPEAARDWHAGTLPTVYVIGADGRIVAGHSGLASEEALRREIAQALSRP